MYKHVQIYHETENMKKDFCHNCLKAFLVIVPSVRNFVPFATNSIEM